MICASGRHPECLHGFVGAQLSRELQVFKCCAVIDDRTGKGIEFGNNGAVRRLGTDSEFLTLPEFGVCPQISPSSYPHPARRAALSQRERDRQYETFPGLRALAAFGVDFLQLVKFGS